MWIDKKNDLDMVLKKIDAEEKFNNDLNKELWELYKKYWIKKVSTISKASKDANTTKARVENSVLAWGVSDSNVSEKYNQKQKQEPKKSDLKESSGSEWAEKKQDTPKTTDKGWDNPKEIVKNKMSSNPQATKKASKINSKFLWWEVSSDFMDLWDLDSLTTDQLFEEINKNKIYFDIDSPLEWQEWIEENKDKLPSGFWEKMKKDFPEIYTDVDGSIWWKFDINNNIKTKASEIYKQTTWPYIIDFNELSDDLLYDLPVTWIWRRELLESMKAKSFGINPDSWILKYDSKDKALKDLIILQKSIKDASDSISEILSDYKDWIVNIYDELLEAGDDERISDIIIIFLREITPTLIALWIIWSMYRVVNRTLIRWWAWSDNWFARIIDKITLWSYNTFDPGNAPSATEFKAAELQNEINTRRKFQLQYEYVSWKDASDLFAKYWRVKETMLEQTFYRKLGNRVVNRWLLKRIFDILWTVLIRNFKDEKVEKNLKKLIPIKNETLNNIFEDTRLVNKKDWDIIVYEKREVANDSKLKWDLKNIYDKIRLSHRIDNATEDDVKTAMDRFIDKLRTWENIDVRWMKNSDDVIKKIKKDLLKEINKVKWLKFKVNEKFLDKTWLLEDAEWMFKTIVGDSKNINKIINDVFANSDSNTKAQLASFFTVVLSDWWNRYDEKTAIFIVNEILNWKSMENAINEALSENNWQEIDWLKINSTSFELSLKNINSSYELTGLWDPTRSPSTTPPVPTPTSSPDPADSNTNSSLRDRMSRFFNRNPVDKAIDKLSDAEISAKYTEFSNMLKSIEFQLILGWKDLAEIYGIQESFSRSNTRDYFKDFYKTNNIKIGDIWSEYFKNKFWLTKIVDFVELDNAFKTKISSLSNRTRMWVSDILWLSDKIRSSMISIKWKSWLMDSLRLIDFDSLNEFKFKI